MLGWTCCRRPPWAKPENKNQYLADVTRENEERHRRNEEMKKCWIRTHQKPETGRMPHRDHPWTVFSFSDNLTTLMFVDARDPSNAQRERLTSSLSLQGVYVTATFKNVMAVFVELFCTPKCSTENPSLRVNTYAGNTSRTFIVEDFIEDEFGHWATSRRNWRTRLSWWRGIVFLDMGQH